LIAKGLEKARHMSLYDQLAQKKAAITKQWFDAVINTYSAETTRFLRSQKDPFANPVGQTTLQNLTELVNLLIDEDDLSRAQSLLDPIIRIRAIQDFTAARAVRFVFDLKGVIRSQLPQLDDRESRAEMALLEQRVDELGLMAFDIYMRCREKIFDLKANDVRNRTFKAFARAGLIKEPGQD